MGIDEKVERNKRWRRKREMKRGGRWEAKWAVQRRKSGKKREEGRDDGTRKRQRLLLDPRSARSLE